MLGVTVGGFRIKEGIDKSISVNQYLIFHGVHRDWVDTGFLLFCVFAGIGQKRMHHFLDNDPGFLAVF